MKLLLSLMMALTLVSPFTLKVDAAGSNMKTAETITINENVTGSITSSGEMHYYKFTIGNSGTVVLDFEADCSNFYFNLFDVNGDNIYSKQSNFDNVLGVNEGTCKLALLSGTYYARIGTQYGTSNKGKYSFSTYFVASNETIKEDYVNNNNTIKTAQVISINKNYNGIIARGDEKDIYKFYLGESGKIYLSSTFNFNLGEIKIYDESGTQIYSDTDNSWDTNTKTHMQDENIYLNKGIYYIAFKKNDYGTNDDRFATYNFKMSFKSTQETVGKYCGGNNNTLNEASVIILTPAYKTIKGQIACSDEVDFYKFNVERTANVSFYVETNVSPSNFYVYDASGKEIYKDTYNYVDKVSGIANYEYTQQLEAGTYYFCIKATYTDYTGGNLSNSKSG